MRSKFFLFAFLFFTWLTPVFSEKLPQKCVLVVGGAGFIGSHVNELLHQEGYQTIVLDNLSTGNRAAVQHGIFIKGDIADSALLDEIFTTYPIAAVMHFAAYIDVGESVRDPLKYYINNVSNTLNLLDRMHAHRVNVFVFSSTAAVFGETKDDIISEEHPCHPVNPYGRSKLMIENVLEDMSHAYGFSYCSLRYFNAAGGDPEGILKNYSKKQSNLIPVILRSLKNLNDSVTIFGTDYPTPDGTGIRDYIHVMDIGSAHIAAMERLFNNGTACCYNLGNGRGFSVKEVIAAVEKVTGKKVNVIEGARRPGDLGVVVANSEKAKQELNWKTRYPSLQTIIEHSWRAIN